MMKVCFTCDGWKIYKNNKLLRQSAFCQSALVGVLFTAAVDDNRFNDGGTHGPIGQILKVIIGDGLVVKPTLVAMFSNKFGQLDEQILINVPAHNVLMRPLGHRFGIGPFDRCNECDQVRGQW